jgi:hypothetical protein
MEWYPHGFAALLDRMRVESRDDRSTLNDLADRLRTLPKVVRAAGATNEPQPIRGAGAPSEECPTCKAKASSVQDAIAFLNPRRESTGLPQGDSQ